MHLSARRVKPGSAGAGSLVHVALSAEDTSMLQYTHVRIVISKVMSTFFLFLPKRGSNLWEESNVCVFSPVFPPLPLHRSPLSAPDLRAQLEAQKLRAGRTKLPDGGSVNAAPSASARRSRAAALCCSLNNQRGHQVTAHNVMIVSMLKKTYMTLKHKAPWTEHPLFVNVQTDQYSSEKRCWWDTDLQY